MNRKKCCRDGNNFNFCLTSCKPSNSSNSLSLKNGNGVMNFIYNKWRGNRMLINFLNINVNYSNEIPSYVKISQFMNEYTDKEIFEYVRLKEYRLVSYYSVALQSIIETTLNLGIARYTNFREFEFKQYNIDEIYENIDDELENLILIKYNNLMI